MDIFYVYQKENIMSKSDRKLCFLRLRFFWSNQNIFAHLLNTLWLPAISELNPHIENIKIINNYSGSTSWCHLLIKALLKLGAIWTKLESLVLYWRLRIDLSCVQSSLKAFVNFSPRRRNLSSVFKQVQLLKMEMNCKNVKWKCGHIFSKGKISWIRTTKDQIVIILLYNLAVKVYIFFWDGPKKEWDLNKSILAK